jgi:aspartate kinase
MKVFKFGGASIGSIERFHQVANIIKHYPDQKILVVVSAMGKTTNALEKVAESFYDNRKDDALELFGNIKKTHLNTAKYLLVTTYNEAHEKLQDFFTEVEWLLHDKPVREYDYYYDQIVCSGELMSSLLLSCFLRESGISNSWLDVRDILRTDNNFREAGVDWDITKEKVNSLLIPELNRVSIAVTQGFLGATDANESTTLGREGSDYSAAVFANLMDAESQTIWKDVEGVMNADPKDFPDATVISALSYDEVIEMSFYGAQVIHPRTIQPLQQKSIPLYVKCFLDPNLQGTVIHKTSQKDLPAIIVLKKNQVLLHLHSMDYSFVGEKPLEQLYHKLGQLRFRPNLVQSGAVTIQLCVDDHPEKLPKLASEAASLFDVQLEKELTLLSIRHYREGITEKLTEGHTIVLLQKTPDTLQILMR